MTIDSSLLDILVCPETKQALHLADDTWVEGFNTRVKRGRIRTRAGALVDEPVEALLLREDKKFVYPVRGGIPVMLIDAAVPADDVLAR